MFPFRTGKVHTVIAMEHDSINETPALSKLASSKQQINMDDVDQIYSEVFLN